ncbi:MAG TPA: succinate dehydrogenase cytochrome b subunit [Gemmatimonadales bacterium]|nr:succinate dehydrogenase cytochrome b subunit [Gemmatimonadales bacterium]
MTRARLFWRSTIGKKIVMALTGLVLVGFVVAHMLGNLQALPWLGGEEKLNAYARFLQGLGGGLWALRIVLLVSLVLHVTAAYQLTRLDLGARPRRYVRKEPQASTVAARTIRWGGVFLLLFIVLHLANFTFGVINPNRPFVHAEVYDNVVAAYRRWYFVVLYLAAMVALGLHLYHGVWGMLRTLGLEHPGYARGLRTVATVLAVIVSVGFAAIPIAVAVRLVR